MCSHCRWGAPVATELLISKHSSSCPVNNLLNEPRWRAGSRRDKKLALIAWWSLQLQELDEKRKCRTALETKILLRSVRKEKKLWEILKQISWGKRTNIHVKFAISWWRRFNLRCNDCNTTNTNRVLPQNSAPLYITLWEKATNSHSLVSLISKFMMGMDIVHQFQILFPSCYINPFSVIKVKLPMCLFRFIVIPLIRAFRELRYCSFLQFVHALEYHKNTFEKCGEFEKWFMVKVVYELEEWLYMYRVVQIMMQYVPSFR